MSAPEDVQKIQGKILALRGVSQPLSAALPPNQVNLLGTGSGLLTGGVAAVRELADIVQTLNHAGATASNLFEIM